MVPQTSLASLDATTLVLVATRPRQLPGENISIDAIQYGATRPMLGVPFTFRAQVSNGTRQPHKLGLNLVVDDQVVAHRDLEVPAGQSAVTRFVYRFTKTGWQQGRVEWDGVDRGRRNARGRRDRGRQSPRLCRGRRAATENPGRRRGAGRTARQRRIVFLSHRAAARSRQGRGGSADAKTRPPAIGRRSG